MPTEQQTQVRHMRVKTGIEPMETARPQDPAKDRPAKGNPKARKEARQASAKPAKPEPAAGSTAVLTKIEKPAFGMGRFLAVDRLLRNIAVVGALLLVVVAVRNTGTTPTQSVFAALQSNVNVEWDESLGKLSFVSNLIPSSVQAVWNEQDTASVLAPSSGEVVHAWSEAEPYLELKSGVADVRAAANGEIMSIAHGLDEELIVRLRHDDNTETLYGNLAACYMDVGDYVFAGDIIATVLNGKPLAFELRKDGRSIDPKGKLKSLHD